MDRLSSLLPKVLRKRGIQSQVQEALVIHCAKRWFHERFPSLQGMISVSKYENGVLFIECTEDPALQACRGSFADVSGFLLKETGIYLEEIHAIRG